MQTPTVAAEGMSARPLKRSMALGFIVALVAAAVLVGTSLVGGTAGRTDAAAATIRPNTLSAGDTYTLTISKIGTVEVNSFSFGVSGTVSAKGLVGRRQHSPFTFVRSVDASSPKFFLAASAGTPLGSVKLEVAPPEGEFGDSVTITLSNAVVAADSWSGPGDEAPSESLTLAYSAITIKYTNAVATG
jgi:type VI secretion system Hcp family effector